MTTDLVLPAERCYWVRLPPSNRRWSRDRLLAGIEPWIPSPVDRLDLAWGAGSDGHVLVVACEPECIDELIATQPRSLSLVPDRVPEHVEVPGVSAGDLQFLTGKRTPAIQQRQTKMICGTAVLITIACLMMLAVGAYRKGQSLEDQRKIAVDGLAAQLSNEIPVALGGRDPDPANRLDQAQRLAAGLSRAADGADGGAADIFAAVLAGWPASLRVQVQSISGDTNRLTIIGTASSVEDAQAVANAIATAVVTAPGWRVLPFQAINAGSSVSFTCLAAREGAGE